MTPLHPSDNKFHKGNGADSKHYWLTPPELMQKLQAEFAFDFDACPFPKPDDFDGLTCEWGSSTYVNPPFGSIIHEGKKKGPTAWMRKAIAENKKGKRVVVVYPVDKWVLMMLSAGAVATPNAHCRGVHGDPPRAHCRGGVMIDTSTPMPCPDCTDRWQAEYCASDASTKAAFEQGVIPALNKRSIPRTFTPHIPAFAIRGVPPLPQRMVFPVFPGL